MSAVTASGECRTAVVVGGESGLEGRLEVRRVNASMQSPTSVVHDMLEVLGDGSVRPAGGPWRHDPEQGGALLRVVRFAPRPATDSPGHLHATPTLDFGIVISGAAWLFIDGDRILLNAGDSFVLRGADHAWFNDGVDDCVLAVVLIGSPTTRTAVAEGI